MNTWICDTCGEIIKQPTDGWVEWLTSKAEDGKRRSHGLRLVHHKIARPNGRGSCQYPDTGSNVSLSHQHLTIFLGDDGLMGLLTFLHEKEFANEEEVLELIKRLHIPGYEHAFRHFEAAISEGVFWPNSPPRYPSQYDINAILEWMRRKT